MQLNNKRIVITGGTSGIGLELVARLCDQNEVIVLSRSNGTTHLNNTKYFQVDLANSTQLESAVDDIIRNYDSIDVLINNAAIQNVPEFLSDDFEYDGIQREIDLNFSSVCQLTYLMLPLLFKDTPSVILNVNSGLALSPKRSSAIYCATKGALNVFSQSLGYQLENSNISVQQAFLPLVDTNMTKGRGKRKLSANRVAEQILSGIESNKTTNDIGKVWLLRLLTHVAPGIARAIMRNS